MPTLNDHRQNDNDDAESWDLVMNDEVPKMILITLQNKANKKRREVND